MRVTCPCCDVDFPLEAGFADADGKRLAATFAEFEPALGRATISYLRLFKPAKTSLRQARALRLAQELADLVRAGTVCRDERTGMRRPAAAATWAAGIEQMLQRKDRLTLPLENHNYLREVVYALADAAEARTEQTREADLRAGRHRASGVSPVRPGETPLVAHLGWLRQQRDLNQITEEDYAVQVEEARARLGGRDG